MSLLQSGLHSKSPERVCRALVTLWGPMLGSETEILLIKEDLGL